MKEIFTDGVADILLSRGLVSIDFFHYDSLEEKGPLRNVPFFRITLPLNGLLGLFDTSKTVVENLVKAGVFIAEPAQPAGANKDAAPAVEKKAEKKAAKSAPAKKAEAKPAAKPAPAPAKKVAPAPAKKPAAKGKKK